MKRTLIGCWLTLLGTIWGAGVITAATQMLVNSWDPSIGRLMATTWECQLILHFGISALFLVPGLSIMTVEFFKKSN